MALNVIDKEINSITTNYCVYCKRNPCGETARR